MKTKLQILMAVLICMPLMLRAQSNFTGSGISLKFNGDDANYVDAGDNFNSLDYPFTVEAWVNADNYSSPYSTIFTLDNPLTTYYGFWFRLNSSGGLILEMGSGSGSGSTSREGLQTTAAVPLHQWVHVAAVCNSTTDIHFYFNGVEKSSVSTGGSASIPSLTHSSDHARIGNMKTPFDIHPFDGQIDEVRLWDVALSQTDIRDNMCRKLSGSETGLVGYWKMDEDYSGTTVLDYSSTGADGEFVGDISKITSGAPLGDVSKYIYTSDWDGVKIKLESSNEDYFRVKDIENSPYGMQLYRVDDEPYFMDGLSDHTPYYYGAFPINNATPADFGISYHFSTTNGVVTEENEDISTLFTRADNSEMVWDNGDAVIDAHQPFIRIVSNSSRKEVIFNVDWAGMKFPLSYVNINIYPNPSADFITVQNIKPGSIVSIFNEAGEKLIRNENFDAAYLQFDISVLTAGVYIVQIDTNNSITTQKIIKL